MKAFFFSFFLLFVSFSVIFPQKYEKSRESITNILSELPASTEYSVFIYDPVTADTIYAVYPYKTLTPASNTKLFSTATAIALMGGDYQVSTKLMTTDKNLTDGIINGDLYIKGYGNSLFTSNDLEKMVRELKALGVRSVTGDIIGDDTYFDDVYSREDWIEEEAANVKVPPVSALVIDRNTTTVKVKKRRRYVTRTVSVSDPSLHAASRLKNELIAAGISVNGSTGKGAAPVTALAIAESSVQLKDLIASVNKRSDNFLAECLFKLIGAVYSGEEGNSFYSTQAIVGFLKENGIHYGETIIVDGSGISRSDNMSAATIVDLLEKMYFDISNYEDFKNSLSICGVDGTLRGRMINTKAEGNFYGKTGTLNGVTALAGYLSLPSGKDIIISIMIQYESGGAHYYKNIEDRIVEAACE